MGTAIKHPVPDRVKPSFVIFDIRTLWRSAFRMSECSGVKKYKWRLSPVWHRMLYSCTHVTTVGVNNTFRAFFCDLVQDSCRCIMATCAGVDVVCERATATEEGEQDALVAKATIWRRGGRRRRNWWRRRWRLRWRHGKQASWRHHRQRHRQRHVLFIRYYTYDLRPIVP